MGNSSKIAVNSTRTDHEPKTARVFRPKLTDSSLLGRVAIVTGAGQGLGKAITSSLAEHGATVWACDIKKSQITELAEELSAQGCDVEPFTLDVTKESDIEELLDRVMQGYGKVDFAINNAGTDVTKPLPEMSVEEWDGVINVNLRGPFLLSRAVYLQMKKQGHGHIVNIASTAAKRTWTEASAYHASKWGLLGFSHSLHAEGRRDNIKVTAVVSGGMRTSFILDRFPDVDPSTLQDPKNVAETVRFVLSQPAESVIPEVMVIPMKETSWP